MKTVVAGSQTGNRDDYKLLGDLCDDGTVLAPLPSWVRRGHRVCCWVQAKLIIHAIYVYLYHPPPMLAYA